ncbi:MAG: LysM peptidoglycan-binding domain-containing protein [Actinomycetota bacterium]|nr:LysM peptidoglycan-binding domain-containing protein [Actinomycetota bacterium]
MAIGDMKDQIRKTNEKMKQAKIGAEVTKDTLAKKKAMQQARPEFRPAGSTSKSVAPGVAKRPAMSGMAKKAGMSGMASKVGMGKFSQASEKKPSMSSGPNAMAFYTVKKGDTLSGIAKEFYGAATQPYWKLIQDANQDIIKDANLIKPGQVFKIPELPEDMKKK